LPPARASLDTVKIALRVLEGQAERSDPVRVAANGASGYPRLAIVPAIADALGAPLDTRATLRCPSAIRCEARIEGWRGGAPLALDVRLDSPAFARLEVAGRGLELVANSAGFATNPTVRVTAVVEGVATATRQISYFGRG
jgi:hypothetical protein